MLMKYSILYKEISFISYEHLCRFEKLPKYL